MVDDVEKPILPKGFEFGRISPMASKLATATDGKQEFLIGTKPPRLFRIISRGDRYITADFENPIPL